jgi:hypothetical protein
MRFIKEKSWLKIVAIFLDPKIYAKYENYDQNAKEEDLF